ncbi:MAG: hypothetical protein ABI585_01050 [Betaproteobacteria bacterium]
MDATRRGRVFDAFPFFNELDMLEIRLNVLDEVVDRFVLVESTVTYSGLPKPLYFADHRDRFARWANRIEHVIVNDTPDTGDWRWGRERHQRDQVVRGLASCRCDDVVLLSDVDEIPEPSLVAARRRGAYRQHYSMYYLNALQRREDWIGTVALFAFQLAVHGPENVRLRRRGFERVERGGWHFSYAMPPDRIRQKLRAFSHAEFDTPEIAAKVEERRDRLQDLFAHHAEALSVQDIERDDFPAFLKASWRHYADLVRQPFGGPRPAELGGRAKA